MVAEGEKKLKPVWSQQSGKFTSQERLMDRIMQHCGSEFIVACQNHPGDEIFHFPAKARMLYCPNKLKFLPFACDIFSAILIWLYFLSTVTDGRRSFENNQEL